MKYKSDIHEYLQSHQDEMISLLDELVSIRSVMDKASEGAPFGAENAHALEFMLSRCRKYGFITENTDNYVGSADICEKDPALAVLCHLDVVPECDGWSSDPFSLRFDEVSGRLYGRGTSDDKGPAAAAVFAARAIKELGIPMKNGVRLIFGTNEENGSADLQYYLSRRKMPPMVFTPDGSYPVINIEKGMVRLSIKGSFCEKGNILKLHGGSVINAVPGMAEAEISGISAETARGLLPEKLNEIVFSFADRDGILHITAAGASAHASTPEKGRNALTALLELVSALPLSESSQTKAVRALAKLFPCGETDGSSCSVDCRDDISGELTLVLSMLELTQSGFMAKNDIRFPVCANGNEIVTKISGILSRYGFKTEALMIDEPHHTDGNSPFVQTLLSVYEAVTGDKGECLAIGGGTYVHHIEGGVAFGAQFPGEDVNMHGADEFITVEALLKNAEIMAHAMIELCGEP